MEESQFDELGRDELAEIEDALDSVDPDDVEASSSDGVLTLELRDGVKIVINTHRAARQIWMAGVASAWKFDYVEADSCWRTAAGEELRDTVEHVIKERLGLEVSLRGE
jgi:CyaY protein